jgi:hypothetical protein
MQMGCCSKNLRIFRSKSQLRTTSLSSLNLEGIPTNGDDGFIIDLTLLKEISVDKTTNLITLQSGVFTKETNNAAFEHGLCLRTSILSLSCRQLKICPALGSANTAGVIPMALGSVIDHLWLHVGQHRRRSPHHCRRKAAYGVIILSSRALLGSSRCRSTIWVGDKAYASRPPFFCARNDQWHN